MTSKNALIFISLLGMLSVAIGAFGAHGLKAILEFHQTKETFETAVKYQFYHTLAMFGIYLLSHHAPFNFSSTKPILILFFFGILIFSGSLYILALTGTRWLGAITPIGGLFFILGWCLLAWKSYTLNYRSK